MSVAVTGAECKRAFSELTAYYQMPAWVLRDTLLDLRCPVNKSRRR
jgi:hypothetical protein